jgi:hypothetical protein
MPNVEVLEPSVVLVVAGRNVTEYVQDHLLSLTYTDYLEGESDTLEVKLEDVDRNWQGPWYPEHGDSVVASIGYEKGYKRGQWLPCGDFQIDEVELEPDPDVFTIKALAAGTEHKLRTASAVAYDETTLADIAGQVAKRNGLELEGEIGDVQLIRVTQAQERDLPFLRRLADEYGYAFTVRGKQLCMYKRSDLKAESAVRTLRRSEGYRFTFRDKITHVVESAAVTYHDPVTKETYTGEAQDSESKIRRHSRDARKINIRAENPAQAQLKADAALERANEDQTEASASMMGEVDLVAGVNIELEGWGAFDGKYQIKQSTHTYGRGQGYTTSIECRRVRK